MKIAFVHDFLVQHGGAERVLRAMHETWPDAPIYTLVAHPERQRALVGEGARVHTSFLQRIPFVSRRYQWLLPLMPAAIEQLNVMDYDVIVSSSSAFAKGVITHPRTLHICYCHTPTRYLWTDTHTYIDELRLPPFVKRALPFILTRMRVWDKQSADRVDYFVANSENVRGRIKKYYQRQSAVIHPPVDIEQFVVQEEGRRDFFLAGGRLVAYKRFDLIVQAFNRLGVNVKIFGTGPALESLRSSARPNVEFLGFVSEEEKIKLYQSCAAFVHPQEEDFGISMVEAMAAGRPVIAYRRGGAAEVVIPDETGVFFDEQIWESLVDAILHFDAEQYDAHSIRQHAEQWNAERFKQQLKKYVEEKWEVFNETRKQ